MKILNSATEARNDDDTTAKKDDLCLALQLNLNSLYLLAFLLTASHAEAEQCIGILIDKTFKPTVISRTAVASFLKLSLIDIAVHRYLKRRRQLAFPQEHLFRIDATANDGIDNVMDIVIQLSPLTRIVFVLTVLERQSDKACAALLQCSMTRVIRVRELAFRRLRQKISTMPEGSGDILLAHIS